jgi:large subunit ribosomal protein L15
MITKKRKSVRFRGSKTHGWGSMKKHRGAGNRGGRGMAGTGKRAGQNQPTILKKYGRSYYGKHGFRRPQSVIKKIKTINLLQLPNQNEIDLTRLGYNKLLGTGKIDRKITVKVQLCSAKAREKIEKAGGQVVLPAKTKEE